MTLERLLDVGPVARRLQVCPDTVRDWIKSGKLAAVKTPTGRYRIPASELARILDTRNTQYSRDPRI